jgi:ketosteroid isomerase-like protein
MLPDPASETFEAFRERLDAAVLGVMNGDSSAWEEIYSHAPDATLFGGWGGPGEKGWEQLAARWKMVTGRYRSSTLQIERVSEHITPEMAVTVEIERGEAQFSDGSSGPIALRVTHVFRREEGQWRLVHRHADEQMKLQPIESHIQRL